jgi:hypothetical protein
VVVVLENRYVYAFWRRRKHIALNLLLPAAALALLWLVSGGSAILTQPTNAAAFMILVATEALIVALWFPRANMHVLTASLVWVGLILLSPVADLLAARIDGPMQDKHWWGATILGLVSGALIGWAVEHVVRWLYVHTPRTTVSFSAVVDTRLSAPDAYAAVRAVPDSTGPLQTTGSADASGRFPVWVNDRYRGLPETDTFPAPKDRKSVPHCQLTVKESGPTACTMIAEMPDGTGAVTHVVVEPMENGSRVTMTETTNHLNLLLILLCYLDEAHKDYLVARIDLAEGRTLPRAIRLQPNDTPILWFARLCGVSASPPPA